MNASNRCENLKAPYYTKFTLPMFSSGNLCLSPVSELRNEKGASFTFLFA